MMSARPTRKSSDYKKSKPSETPSKTPIVLSGQTAQPAHEEIPKMSEKHIWILRILFFIFLFCFWTFRYNNYLYMVQEYDLFVWRLDYLQEASTRVAGLSRYLSSFVIQFFYYPILGALLLAALGLVMQYATEKFFQLRTCWGVALSFVPPCLSALSITNAHYYIFERIDVAYLFSFTFNFCFVLVFGLLFESFKNSKKRILYLLIAYLFTYPVFGFFALFAAFLCILKEWSRPLSEADKSNVVSDASPKSTKKPKSPTQRHREKCELITLFVLLVPLGYWFAYSETTPDIYHMYTAGLWEESTLPQGREAVESNLITPYLILLKGKLISRDTATNSILWFYITLEILFLLVLSIVSAVFTKRSKKFTCSSCAFSINVSIVIVLCSCCCTIFLSFSSPNFQSLLRVARALEEEDWEKIICEESKVKEPINPLISARILVLFKTNRIGEELFERPLQPKYSSSLSVIGTASMGGDRILYEYGATNLSAKIATNNLVIKRERSAWALKTLSLCAIVDQRPSLAKRFLYPLQGTLFHKKFADELLDYLNNNFEEGKYDEYLSYSGKTSQKRLDDLECHFASIRRLKPLEDSLYIRGSVDNLLFTIAQNDAIDARSIQERENLLAIVLLSRNFQHFGLLLDEYLKDKGEERIPRYLQEALLWRERFPHFFDNNTEKTWTAPENVVIDQQIRDNFSRFIKDLDNLSVRNDSKINNNSALTSEELIDLQLKEKYGDTFWYFFGAPSKLPSY